MTIRFHYYNPTILTKDLNPNSKEMKFALQIAETLINDPLDEHLLCIDNINFKLYTPEGEKLPIISALVSKMIDYINIILNELYSIQRDDCMHDETFQEFIEMLSAQENIDELTPIITLHTQLISEKSSLFYHFKIILLHQILF